MTELAGQLPLLGEGILLHELNHRVNNEFATAISTVSLAAARSNDDNIKSTLSEVAEVLHQYADVHRALQMPDHDIPVDAAAYLKELCRSITRSQLDPRKIELVLVTQSLWLCAHRCWLLGMIVFELVNNAARHAFSGGEGAIRVELSVMGAVAECSVRDNGSTTADIRPGRGLAIIEELSKNLGGRLEQTFRPWGSNSILLLPCDRAPRTGLERHRNVSEHTGYKNPVVATSQLLESISATVMEDGRSSDRRRIS